MATDSTADPTAPPAKARGASAAPGTGTDGAGERRLFLIDGPSLVYRAFFALPESIATSTGVPTNAIFGFASMLVKIVTDYGVQPTVVAWDAGSSGRTEVYSEYKSQRRSRPDLLKQQWPAMEPLVEAFGYSNVKVDGYEADDVIASLAERALHADPAVPVMIVTGDRDAFQLINGDGLVKVMATSRGITETKIYDRQAVIDRYGIAPELIPDFYGLKGDTSDNIPGVPGIGDKTASELLQRFGSLETVLDSVDEISGAKRKQNLTEHAEDARLSKQLATLKYDIDVPIDVSKEARTPPDRSRLREVAAEFELRAVMQRLDEEFSENVPDRAVEETLMIEPEEGTPADLPEGPVTMSIAEGRWAGTDGNRVVAGDYDDLAALAGRIHKHPLTFHDAKSQGGGGRTGLVAVAPAGTLDLAHDTMVAAYLIDPARRVYDLSELAADAGLAAASAAAAESGAEEPAESEQLSLAPEGEPTADPPTEARLAFELAARQREQIERFGLERVL